MTEKMQTIDDKNEILFELLLREKQKGKISKENSALVIVPADGIDLINSNINEKQ